MSSQHTEPPQAPLGEVLFQFLRMGGSVKVTAMHSQSLTEISIICPASLGVKQMQAQAVQKLRFVLGRSQ